MMYSQRFVAVIKVNGKVLRESGDVVTLPFGSEYTILLKNLNSVRAVVDVTVDGTVAIDQLIVEPRGEVELERFVTNNNLERGNCFKFIERTSAIENHRGIGVEDGLIRVEYRFEKLPEQVITRTVVEKHVHQHEHHYPGCGCGMWPYSHYTIGQTSMPPVNTTPTIFCNAMFTRSSANPSPLRAAGAFSDAPQNVGYYSYGFPVDECSMRTETANENGITVPGSESTQRFITVPHVTTEDRSEVLVLKLRGRVGERPVVKAVTTDRKPTCTSCGRVNKANSKFCSECGTSLILI